MVRRRSLKSWQAVACGILFVATGRAEEALNPPPPLAVPVAAVSSGTKAVTLGGAQRAQELGLSSIAAAQYRQLLDLPGADRATLTLALATALLDGGRAAEVEQLLSSYAGTKGPAWHLRAGLAAAQLKRFDEARAEVNRTNVDELARPDRAWFWFLQGLLYDTAAVRDPAKAEDFYRKAEAEAPTELARARFQVAEQRVRLRLVPVNPADMEQARKTYEARQGLAVGYHAAENYAVMRDASGAKGDAVRFLQGVLVALPRMEREWTDQFGLLLGLIGDRTRTGAGRHALNQLLETGRNADKQRAALEVLAQDSAAEPERGQFRIELDKLIAATPAPAILDSLLLIRAQLALSDNPKDHATAEQRANELKDKFPGSPLRAQALGVLAESAWEQRRYRVAADDARQARDALTNSDTSSPGAAAAVGRARAELGVVQAEASYRAGDFRNAADAYASVLRENPVGLNVGDLMFQRVLAEIRADSPAAIAVVDELARNPDFAGEYRWEAEWSLARALRRQGRTREALARVAGLLSNEPGRATAISPDLRARLAWLQARLAFDAGQPEQTIGQLENLDVSLGAVSAPLRTEIASTDALLKAQAEFALNNEAAALGTLKKLRVDSPTAEAAEYSYLIEASYYADHDKIQDAQKTLRSLIDNKAYAHSEYVPYALFQLALLSERLGQEKDLREANDRIEELVKPDRDPPAPAELIFAARLKQGDLLRTMNQFPQAQRAYEDLVNNPKYAQRPDVVLAQLKLAECHNAQSSADPSHADIAQLKFEELRDRADAPDDVRVEAGYNLGALLLRRGQPDKARDVWWDVITQFLESKNGFEPGATRPYWLARTLLELGALLEQQGNIADAKRVYLLLRDKNLGSGEAMARDRLQRLGVPSAIP
jgi:cellulose synthase operon protein C